MNFLAKDDDKSEWFLSSALSSFILVAIVKFFWSSITPFGLFEVWHMGHGSTWDGVKAAWPIYLWGCGLTTLVCVCTSNSRSTNRNAEDIIGVGTLLSVMAGVTEEIAFRWWFFYGAILGLKVLSWITCGLVAWFVTHVPIPIAAFFTPSAMHPYYYGFGWAVGGAILSSNGKFRNGHLYLGWFGYVNSWFLGLFFFWLMFNYGLLAAILAHWFYDQLIFTAKYIDACVERRLGWV